jgi:Flp pilus assembly protein TadD
VALVVAIPLAGATHARNFTWADTIRLHQDCARKSPGKFRPQYNLGTVLGQLGQYVEAVAALRKAVALEPDSSKAHNHLGAVYWSLNLPDRAIGEYRAAVRLGPDNAQALYNLAAVLDSRGETGEAVGLYRRFLDSAPSTLASSREQVRRRLASMTALAQSSDGERGGGARGEETRQEEQPP